MLLKWHDRFNIGVSEIDAEHKYLVALINNLHDVFCSNGFDRRISDVLVHLTKYVTKHLNNEESLMKSCNFPSLKAHMKLHENLVYELSDLSEDYMSGKEINPDETMAFLNNWLFDHIMSHDQQIGYHLQDHAGLKNWSYTPAYSGASQSHFKKCTCCGKTWKTLNDLAKDDEKIVLGCMADLNNHLFNLMTYNRSCGTTLAIPLTDFIDNCDIPFELEQRDAHEAKPSYCLKTNASDACLSKCACVYTDKILKSLNP